MCSLCMDLEAFPSRRHCLCRGAERGTVLWFLTGRFLTWDVILVNVHMISIPLVRVQVRAIPSGRLHLNTLPSAKFLGIFLF